jgi:hypothetical protein
MITTKVFSDMALALPGTEETKHFDRIGYKVIGRRMFATYLSSDNTCNVFLTPKEQTAFCKVDVKNIYPVPNKWGEKGATTFVLNHVDRDVLSEALTSAYNDIVSAKPTKKTK